jgi:methylisocitrate lyase
MLCSRYYAAGADVVFIEAPQSVDEFRAIRAAFASDVPLFANVFEGTPYRETLLSAQALEELGYQLVVFPMSPAFAAMHGMRAKLRELRTVGATVGTPQNAQQMAGYNEFLDVIDLKAFRALEEKYELDAEGRFSPPRR